MDFRKTGLNRQATVLALGLFGLAHATHAYSADASGEVANNQYYISVFVGAGFTDDASFAGIVTPPGGPQTVDTDFDTGLNFGGAVGLFLPSLATDSYTPRMELELSHLNSDADTLDFSGNGVGNENNTSGDISRTLLMVNALVDIDTGSEITPFLGAGIGAAFTDIDIVYGGAPGAPPPILFSDDDTNLAAQAIIGASYELTQETSVFVDGRYTRIFDVDGARFNPGGLTGIIEDDVSNYSVNVGLSYKF